MGREEGGRGVDEFEKEREVGRVKARGGDANFKVESVF